MQDKQEDLQQLSLTRQEILSFMEASNQPLTAKDILKALPQLRRNTIDVFLMRCNVGLGYFEDNVQLLLKAALYLETRKEINP